MVLVCVGYGVGELGAEFEDDEANDEAEHEDYDVRDRYGGSRYWVRYSWKAKNYGFDDYQYYDSSD